MKRNLFKSDWRNKIFKPDKLVVGKGGVTLNKYGAPYPLLFETPAKLLNHFNNDLLSCRLIRIYLDTVEHHSFQVKLPLLSWWDRRMAVQNHIQGTMQEGNLLFCKTYSSSFLKGLIALTDSTLSPWLEVIEQSKRVVEGIYSLPFELGQLAVGPQLLVLPTAFHEIRLIFSDSKGGLFTRTLPQPLEEVIEHHIEQTLNYVCREYQVSVQDISVVSKYSCPNLQPHLKDWQIVHIPQEAGDTFLLSLLYSQGYIPQRRFMAGLQKKWQQYLQVRLLKPGSVILLSLLLGLSFLNVWKSSILQQECTQLQTDIEHLQTQTALKDIVALEKQLSQLKDKTAPFYKLQDQKLKVLTILRKLLPPRNHDSVYISQLSLVQGGSSNHIRLLMECTIRDPKVMPGEGELRIGRYSQNLAAQFPHAIIKVENHESNSDQVDLASACISEISATIQMDGIFE